MREIITSVILGISAAACSGGGAVAETTTSAVVHCSSESGPVVGPIPTHAGSADAGVVRDCNPGGKCVYTSEFPGSGRCTVLDDGGCELSLVLGPVVDLRVRDRKLGRRLRTRPWA
jgi:hypothetical protein